MKLVSFSRLGKARFGAVVKDGVIDLTGKLDPDVNTIKELISLHMEDQAEEFIAGKNKDLSFSDIIFLPVIPDPEKIMCVGLNYVEHKKEFENNGDNQEISILKEDILQLLKE